MAKKSKPLFTADQFQPTRWDTAETKARFANQFARFVAEGFPERLWTQAFYNRLSLTFGHIAHYNRNGFWDTFFANERTKWDFIKLTLEHPCYGDPAWTYSDVERAIQQWLAGSGIPQQIAEALAEAVETKERAILARLKAKYEGETHEPAAKS